MTESITIGDNNYITCDLLSNIGDLKGHANIDHICQQTPNLSIVNSQMIGSSSLSINDDVFLEKNDLEEQAIWLKQGSQFEKDIMEALNKDPVLNHEQLNQTIDRLIQQQALYAKSSLHDFINNLPESTYQKFEQACYFENNTFPWQEILNSISLDEKPSFFITPQSDSCEVSVKLNVNEQQKEWLQDTIDARASDVIAKHETPYPSASRKSRNRP